MAQQSQKFTVSEAQAGTRIDKVMLEALSMTRSQAKRLIDRDRVLVDGEPARKSGLLMSEGQEVEVLPLLTEVEQEVVEDTSIYNDIQVIFESPDYLIINKPSGLLVHPTEAEQPVTLAHWLREQYPEVDGIGEYDNRPGIVHRLDKDASGIMVVARTQAMFVHLKQQFKDRQTYKEYRVLVHGEVDQIGDGIIDFAIDRGKDGRMAARPKVKGDGLKAVGKEQPGKEAITVFSIEKPFINYTLLKVQIKTGRTHQIRVHMLAYNFPVVGDPVYLQKRYERAKTPGRLFLHAFILRFTDLTGEEQSFAAELPPTLTDFIDTLKPRV